MLVVLVPFVVFGIVTTIVMNGYSTPFPCVISLTNLGIIIGACIFAIGISVVLFFISLCLKIEDRFGLRWEIAIDNVMFLIYAIVALVSSLTLSRTIPALSNLFLILGLALYFFFNITIVGLIPVLRTWRNHTKLSIGDISSMNTWLESDSLRAIFKEFCKSELSLENICL